MFLIVFDPLGWSYLTIIRNRALRPFLLIDRRDFSCIWKSGSNTIRKIGTSAILTIKKFVQLLGGCSLSGSTLEYNCRKDSLTFSVSFLLSFINFCKSSFFLFKSFTSFFRFEFSFFKPSFLFFKSSLSSFAFFNFFTSTAFFTFVNSAGTSLWDHELQVWGLNCTLL